MIQVKKVKFPKEIKVDPRFEKLPLKNLFVFSFFANILFLIIGFLSLVILPPEIPLLYGLPKTNEQLVSSYLIIIPSVATLLFTLINSILSINLESQYLKKTLAFASFLITILNLTATYKIIALVGSI